MAPLFGPPCSLQLVVRERSRAFINAGRKPGHLSVATEVTLSELGSDSAGVGLSCRSLDGRLSQLKCRTSN